MNNCALHQLVRTNIMYVKGQELGLIGALVTTAAIIIVIILIAHPRVGQDNAV